MSSKSDVKSMIDSIKQSASSKGENDKAISNILNSKNMSGLRPINESGLRVTVYDLIPNNSSSNR